MAATTAAAVRVHFMPAPDFAAAGRADAAPAGADAAIGTTVGATLGAGTFMYRSAGAASNVGLAAAVTDSATGVKGGGTGTGGGNSVACGTAAVCANGVPHLIQILAVGRKAAPQFEHSIFFEPIQIFQPLSGRHRYATRLRHGQYAGLRDLCVFVDTQCHGQVG